MHFFNKSVATFRSYFGCYSLDVVRQLHAFVASCTSISFRRIKSSTNRDYARPWMRQWPAKLSAAVQAVDSALHLILLSQAVNSEINYRALAFSLQLRPRHLQLRPLHLVLLLQLWALAPFQTRLLARKLPLLVSEILLKMQLAIQMMARVAWTLMMSILIARLAWELVITQPQPKLQPSTFFRTHPSVRRHSLLVVGLLLQAHLSHLLLAHSALVLHRSTPKVDAF